MDYINLILLLWKFGSYCFDVVSDILNGLSFLHESRNTTVNGIFNTVNDGPFLHNETKFYNVSDRYPEVQIERPDTIWGVLSLSFVFMPGLIYGVVAGMAGIAENWKDCCKWMGVLFFVLSVSFYQ